VLVRESPHKAQDLALPLRHVSQGILQSSAIGSSWAMGGSWASHGAFAAVYSTA
jgi:hypothetical protein